MTEISADLEIRCLNCGCTTGIRKWKMQPEITLQGGAINQVVVQVKEIAFVCPSCALIHRLGFEQPTG